MFRFIHFDHINPEDKIDNISSMICDSSYSIQDISLEISKCRILCAFCHRIHTNYFFGNSYIESYSSIIPGPTEYIFN